MGTGFIGSGGGPGALLGPEGTDPLLKPVSRVSAASPSGGVVGAPGWGSAPWGGGGKPALGTMDVGPAFTEPLVTALPEGVWRR